MYTEATLYPLDGKTSELCDLLDIHGIGYSVDDPAEVAALLEETKRYWDYFDESLTAERPATVKIYLPNETNELETIKTVTAHLISHIDIKSVNESDWADAWKPFWQATTIGENIVIVPEWKTVLRLDPGMLFGTGAHATTSLCLEVAERLFKAKKIRTALDLGCGSGILAIAALLLGAESATGYDVDINMPKIANANASLNNVRPHFEVKDVLTDNVPGTYDLIFANIVADVIIKLAPKVKSALEKGGSFVCSGIIEPRADEVEVALKDSGFTMINKFTKEDWVCYLCE